MKKLQPELFRGLQLRKPNKCGSVFFPLITEITKERESDVKESKRCLGLMLTIDKKKKNDEL